MAAVIEVALDRHKQNNTTCTHSRQTNSHPSPQPRLEALLTSVGEVAVAFSLNAVGGHGCQQGGVRGSGRLADAAVTRCLRACGRWGARLLRRGAPGGRGRGRRRRRASGRGSVRRGGRGGGGGGARGSGGASGGGRRGGGGGGGGASCCAGGCRGCGGSCGGSCDDGGGGGGGQSRRRCSESNCKKKKKR